MAYEEETAHADAWARIYLQPIAAPSILLGLYGFAGATSWSRRQYGALAETVNRGADLIPICRSVFGGMAHYSLAGMWRFLTTDGLATAMHGMWGSFWLSYGLLYLLVAVGKIAVPAGPWPELGYWFVVLAAITWVGADRPGLKTRAPRPRC